MEKLAKECTQQATNGLFWKIVIGYLAVMALLILALHATVEAPAFSDNAYWIFFLGVVLSLPAFFYDHYQYLRLRDYLLGDDPYSERPILAKRELLTGGLLSQLPGMVAPIYYVMSDDYVGTFVLIGVSSFLFLLFKPD